MTGRDPAEPGRSATPLELLFDLTFVVAVGTAASHFAEMLAEGHALEAVGAFTLAMFAISVAWISFSWFSSAFATDEWHYRVLTMVQMVGVIVFSLGLPTMFHSIEEGEHLELRAMVIGYVVIRIAMVLQWWRAARESPPFHDVGMRNIRCRCSRRAVPAARRGTRTTSRNGTACSRSSRSAREWSAPSPRPVISWAARPGRTGVRTRSPWSSPGWA